MRATNDETHCEADILQERQISSWIRRLIEIVVLDVGHDTDDLSRCLVVTTELKSLPDWILARQKPVGESLIDQNNAR